MKNLNFKKTAGLACLIIGFAYTSNAQTTATGEVEEVKKGEMKVVVISDENGEVNKTVETFSLEDKDKVKKMLKEKGIEMEFGEDSGYQFVVGEGSGRNVMIQTKEKSTGKEGDSESVTKEVRVFNFVSDSEMNGNTFESEDVRVNVEEVEGEHGIKKVVKVIAKGSGEDNEFIIETDAGKVDAGKAMIFIRKETLSKDSDLPTSINEVFEEDSNLKDLSLYPNPTNGNFKINFTSEEAEDIRIRITDAKGSNVYKKNLRNFKGEFNEDFDLSKEDAGVYFFNLTSKGQTVSKKIIVQ